MCHLPLPILNGRLILDWTENGFEQYLPLFKMENGDYLQTECLIFRKALITIEREFISFIQKAKKLKFYDVNLVLPEKLTINHYQVRIESIFYSKVKEETNLIQAMRVVKDFTIVDSRLYFAKD